MPGFPETSGDARLRASVLTFRAMNTRPVLHVVTAHEQLEGGGFTVRRPFPTRGLDFVDPLLLLDELDTPRMDRPALD